MNRTGGVDYSYFALENAVVVCSPVVVNKILGG